MTLDLSQGDKPLEKKPKSMSLKELQKKITEHKQINIEVAPLQTAFHGKITRSFSSLAFILLGFPLAVITHRRQKSANVLIAIICAAAYYVVSLACEALSIQDKTPIALTMWVPNIITAITAGILNYRLCAS